MAMKMNGSSRSSGGGRRRFSAVAEINVTPFVDVMLVLLIVFMVTAPLLTTGISVDLPESAANSLNDSDNKPIEITVDEDGLLYIGEEAVDEEKLVSVLTAMVAATGKDDKRIYIRADESLGYGRVMEVLGNLNRSGFKKVALVSKPGT